MGLEISFCFNKQDLVQEIDVKFWGDCLVVWGYVLIIISVENCWGVEKLQEKLRSCISLMVGFFGVGKFSLINLLVLGVE